MNEDSAAGVGTDIERIDRFRHIDTVAHHIFLERIFTRAEQEYCFGFVDPAPHFAARFCAKEAVIKALMSAGERQTIGRDQIEILPDALKVPRVRFLGYDVGMRRVSISLAHSGEYALATAMVNTVSHL